MAEPYRPKNLAAKIRKAREFSVEIAGFTFVCIRPTDLEWYEKIIGTDSTARYLPFIVNWSGVTEADVLNGGAPHAIEFDSAACAEWLSDNAEIYGKLIGEINEYFKNHTLAREDVAKNSVPGSTPLISPSSQAPLPSEAALP